MQPPDGSVPLRSLPAALVTGIPEQQFRLGPGYSLREVTIGLCFSITRSQERQVQLRLRNSGFSQRFRHTQTVAHSLELTVLQHNAQRKTK